MTRKKKPSIPQLKKAKPEKAAKQPADEKKKSSMAQIERDFKKALIPPDIELTPEQQEAFITDIMDFHPSLLTLSQNVDKVEQFMQTFHDNYQVWKKSLLKLRKMNNPKLLEQQRTAMRKDIMQFLPYMLLLTITMEKVLDTAYEFWKIHGQRQIIKNALKQAEEQLKKPGDDNKAAFN